MPDWPDHRDEFTWVTSRGELTERRPDLAQAGRALIYQFGVGFAFLGTTRSDGGPPLHPICPRVYDGLAVGSYAWPECGRP
jgi:hypothetical protein